MATATPSIPARAAASGPTLPVWVQRALIGVVLAGMSVFATWPLAEHMNEFLNVGDPFSSAWGLWWTSNSLIHFHNPYWTNQMLAPDGSYLAFHALVPLAGIVCTPLIQTIGAGLTYNILQLTLPIFGALTGRLLAGELGLGRLEAWVAGGLFGFSTILDWRTQFHLNFGFALPFVPLAVMFVVRFARTRRRRHAALAGVMLGLIVMSDPTVALLAALAVAAYVVVALAADREWRAWARGIVPFVGATLIVGSPQLIAMLRAATNGGYQPNKAALASSWVNGDTNLATMFSPGNVRGYIPGDLEALAYKHPWGEATPAYGWGVLGLAVLALVLLAFQRRLVRVQMRTVAWALLLFFGATVLALGPEIRFGTTHHIPLPTSRYGQTLSQLMPYTWMTRLPFFADVRIPARFTMLGIIPLAMLAGVGLGLLRGAGRGFALVAALLVAFAVFESGFPDGGVSKQWVPMTRPELYDPIKADKSRSIVVDVPLGFLGATAGAGAGDNEPMFRAIEHGHPIAAGFVTRLTQRKVNALVAHSFYADILAIQNQPAPGTPDIPAPKLDLAAAAAEARRIHVGWVVVTPDANDRVLPFLRATGFREVREDRGTLLFHRIGAPS